jgi:hypothetical protein
VARIERWTEVTDASSADSAPKAPSEPLPPTLADVEFGRFAREFAKESDRAAVILAAAKLDFTLLQLLQRLLLPSPTGSDELLDGDGPLSTFSSRINLAHRLGLISAQFSRSLHLVRRIRNSFAHEPSGLTLETGAHADRVRELALGFDGSYSYSLMVRDNARLFTPVSAQFRAAAALMAMRLEFAVNKAHTVDKNNAWDLFGITSKEQFESEVETARRERKRAT